LPTCIGSVSTLGVNVRPAILKRTIAVLKVIEQGKSVDSKLVFTSGPDEANRL